MEKEPVPVENKKGRKKNEEERPKKSRKRMQRSSKYPFASTTPGDVTAVIESTLFAKDSPVNMQELAYECMKKFGGAQGIAGMIHTNYRLTTSNPSERANLMTILYKILAFSSSKEDGNVEDVSDEDLELTMRRLLAKLGITNFVGEYPTHVCI